ncbi:hypothetical protein B0H66DRAFT_631817, partial [Apodospora peruviana]
LRAALDDFQADISAEDRVQLQALAEKPDVDACITWTASLDRMDRNRRGASIATRLYSFLQSVQQFSTMVDTYISSDPTLAALVWGSVKLAIYCRVVMNFTSYFDEMSIAFKDFHRWSPRLADYQLLFPASSRLQIAVCEYYASIISTCKQLVRIARRSLGQQQLTTVMFTSFHTENKSLLSGMQTHVREVNYEITLATSQADAEEHKRQASERESAPNHRQSLVPFVANVSREIDNAKSWRGNIGRSQAGKTPPSQERGGASDVIDALSTFDHTSAFKRARRKRYQGTGKWLTETTAFQAYRKSSTHAVIWLSGKSEILLFGSGKTVLSASTIDHLFIHREQDETVLFVLLSHSDSSSLQAETIIRSLIRQNLDAENLAQEFAMDILKAKSSLWDVPDLIGLLQKKSAFCRQTYVVIDALDELDPQERRVLLDALSVLTSGQSRYGGLIKLLVTSRTGTKPDIKRVFPTAVHMSLEAYGAQAELAAYTKAVVEERLQSGDLYVTDTTLVDEIVTALGNGAQGMFLWVSLGIEDICSQASDEEIRIALQNLPKTLAETFSRALLRVVARDKALVCQRAFVWILAAKRPLLLAELREAIPLQLGQQGSSPGKAINAIDRLTSWCENLIEADEETEEFRLIHHTVRTYLLDGSQAATRDSRTSRFHVKIEDLDNMIGNLCVTYLNFNDFKTTVSKTSTMELARLPHPRDLMRAIGNDILPWGGVATRLLNNLVSRHADSDSCDGRRITAAPPTISATFGRADLDSLKSLEASPPLIRYASTFWLEHTYSLRRSKHTYEYWKQMVDGSHALAKTPWTNGEFLTGHEKVLSWAQEHRHWALIRKLL